MVPASIIINTDWEPSARSSHECGSRTFMLQSNGCMSIFKKRMKRKQQIRLGPTNYLCDSTDAGHMQTPDGSRITSMNLFSTNTYIARSVIGRWSLSQLVYHWLYIYGWRANDKPSLYVFGFAGGGAHIWNPRRRAQQMCWPPWKSGPGPSVLRLDGCQLFVYTLKSPTINVDFKPTQKKTLFIQY